MASRPLLRALAIAALAGACAGPARFPPSEPMARDDDQQPFEPAPREYVSPFAWDAANQTLFRPISQFFAVRPAGRSVNVNALDEVPDSSWFTNRLGIAPLSEADVARGSCDEHVLDSNAPDKSWTIDAGKDNGANPGFRVNIPGVGKFMLKSDPGDEPERATGATSISSRFYHAVGYFAPCDSVVYFRPAILSLKPGLTVTNNEGVTKPFDEGALARILSQASHRDGLVRMVASKWLPGRTIGPYRYDGIRSDDPNDVILHEDRRELRGARILAAWLNHFDTREQNTMDVFLPVSADKKEKRGYVRHYIIDLGDSFGSVWSTDTMTRRLGHSYMLDFPYLVEDFVTFGAIERPWERNEKLGGVFNYFGARDFDPEMWRGEYPNPAFLRMQEADGAWMARIVARFTDELVAAAVSVGRYDEASTRYLTQALIARRDAVLRRYLSKLSPIADLRIEGHRLCGVDLARKSRIVPDEGLSFRATQRVLDSGSERRVAKVEATPGGNLCVEVAHGAGGYVVIDVYNGYAPKPLVAHLYDLGERGFRLVGVERPD